jgi:LPXTG-site transpeptidase (sortase) family protein
MTQTRKIFWTFGNLLSLLGLYLLLVVGGIKADEQYNVYAASGDNDLVLSVEPTAPVVANQPPAQPTAAPATPTTNAFNIPVLNNTPDDALTNAVPARTNDGGPSTISRIVVPALELDKKVVEVGWTMQKQPDGQEVAVWDVDKYRVGHHKGTSNPGAGGNIVLAGHSGGYAYPFNDIFYLKPGDLIELYSNGQLYQYAVTDHILVDEVGQPLEKRLENARYIEPTDEEMITMVACWPLTGPNKFAQRIIIRSKPLGAPTQGEQTSGETSAWNAR